MSHGGGGGSKPSRRAEVIETWRKATGGAAAVTYEHGLRFIARGASHYRQLSAASEVPRDAVAKAIAACPLVRGDEVTLIRDDGGLAKGDTGIALELFCSITHKGAVNVTRVKLSVCKDGISRPEEVAVTAVRKLASTGSTGKRAGAAASSSCSPVTALPEDPEGNSNKKGRRRARG